MIKPLGSASIKFENKLMTRDRHRQSLGATNMVQLYNVAWHVLNLKSESFEFSVQAMKRSIWVWPRPMGVLDPWMLIMHKQSMPQTIGHLLQWMRHLTLLFHGSVVISFWIKSIRVCEWIWHLGFGCGRLLGSGNITSTTIENSCIPLSPPTNSSWAAIRHHQPWFYNVAP